MTQGFVNPYTYATSAPTVTTYTSGSGTYTTPAGVKFLVVELVGGGGGGAGGGVAGTSSGGTNGGATTFGTLTGNGGTSGGGGSGGGSGTGGNILNMYGNNGSQRGVNGPGFGGIGGAGVNGGCANGGDNGSTPSNTGGNAAANSGAGAGGGGCYATGGGDGAGGGGGAGGYVKHLYSSPAATYSYGIGAGGSAGAAGTNGGPGGAGGSGVIYVYEYYEVLGIPTTLTLPLSVSNGGTGTSVAPSTFYVNTANTTITALSIVKYSNVVNDSASAYSASTGLYTIPTTGWYTVNANIKTTSYNYGSSAIIQIDIRQNSTVIAQQIITPTPYNSTSLALNAGTVYKFTAGDTVSVYGFSNIGGASTTLDNSVTNFLSINFLHS